MRAAIYARYSSENQSEKSIDDQIRVCKNYIEEHGMTVSDEHIYIDEAVSGSIINRPGLQALDKALENKEFDAVVVDDLSRLSRSNHQMLTLVLKFDYHQVKIISVSDGIVTGEEDSKLGIHIRGLINELYLDDLRKKTMRGLEGQKLRGFSTGEDVYGYYTKPVGELKLAAGKARLLRLRSHCILTVERTPGKMRFPLTPSLSPQGRGRRATSNQRRETNYWRTQLQPIRTIGEITARIKILPARQPYLYQKLSKKATQLRLLGMTYGEIVRSLHINRKTAVRACKYKGK